MNLILAIAIVIGFLAWFLATFPVPHAERVARGCFLVAAIIVALGIAGSAVGR
jgi:hypothetical protein